MPTKSTESEITCSLCAGLTKSGVMCDAAVGSKMNKAGRPDRWFAGLAWHGWIEFKKERNALSGPQRAWIWQAARRRPDSILLCRYFPEKDTVAIYWILATPSINSVVPQFETEFPLRGILDDKYWNKDACDRFMMELARISQKGITR